VNGDIAIKTEPDMGDVTTTPSPVPEGTESTEINILVPKKPSRKRRAPSEDDMPPPEPPRQTVRLTIDFLSYLLKQETLEYNVFDHACAEGMIYEWPQGVEEQDTNGDEDGMEVDGKDGENKVGAGMNGVPKAPALIGMGLIDGDPEELARLMDAKYEDKKPSKKVGTQRHT
jgi:hypothetical protein